jgi:hypothetical protein
MNTSSEYSSEDTFFLPSPPFSNIYNLKATLPENAPPPEASIRELTGFITLDIENFDVYKKKSSSDHLFFVGLNKNMSSEDKKNIEGLTQLHKTRLHQRVPVIEPLDYFNLDKIERKKALVEKTVYVASLNQIDYQLYSTLVEKVKPNSTLSETLSILAETMKVHSENIYSRIQKLSKLVTNASKIGATYSVGSCLTCFDGSPMMNGQTYISFMFYYLLVSFGGGDHYRVVNNEWLDPTYVQMVGHNLLWILHIVNPELEKCYKKYCHDTFSLEYAPSYTICDGGAFAEHTQNIIRYASTIFDMKCNFMLKTKNLNERLFYGHKTRSLSSYSTYEKEEISKIIHVMDSDIYFQTAILFDQLIAEISQLNHPGITKLQQECQQQKTRREKLDYFKSNISRVLADNLNT